MTLIDIENLKKYLKETIGVDVEIRALSNERIKALPIAIKGLYEFYGTTLYNRALILVLIKNDFTTDRLRKNFDLISQTLKMPCVAVIDSMEGFTRTRLIEKGIHFIIPGKQMYLPGFLIDLKEYGNNPKTLPTQMQPSAQFLLLYHLQVESLEGYNFMQIADKLNYNGMTITRAAFYLHNTGLCTIMGTKDKQLHFELDNKKLWEAAEPFMSSPVKQANYYSGWIQHENVKKSKYSALSYYTDLNPDPWEYYAVRPGDMKLLENANLKYSGNLEGNIYVEEWKYDPAMLTKNEYVDPLSLYLCYRENENERIQIALEQIIKNMKW